MNYMSNVVNTQLITEIKRVLRNNKHSQLNQTYKHMILFDTIPLSTNLRLQTRTKHVQLTYNIIHRHDSTLLILEFLCSNLTLTFNK